MTYYLAMIKRVFVIGCLHSFLKYVKEMVNLTVHEVFHHCYRGYIITFKQTPPMISTFNNKKENSNVFILC